jgi:hypothetical protein
MFCRYTIWYISLLLSAGSTSKKRSDNGFPVTLCLLFQRFVILCPILSISSLTPATLSDADILLPLC